MLLAGLVVFDYATGRNIRSAGRCCAIEGRYRVPETYE